MVISDVDVIAAFIFATVIGYDNSAAFIDVDWSRWDAGGNDLI